MIKLWAASNKSTKYLLYHNKVDTKSSPIKKCVEIHAFHIIREIPSPFPEENWENWENWVVVVHDTIDNKWNNLVRIVNTTEDSIFGYYNPTNRIWRTFKFE